MEGDNVGCGAPDRGAGAVGLANAAGGGPGREKGGGAAAGGADEGKGGGWPKGDGLGGAELGMEGGRLRFKFCILSANGSGRGCIPDRTIPNGEESRSGSSVLATRLPSPIGPKRRDLTTDLELSSSAASVRECFVFSAPLRRLTERKETDICLIYVSFSHNNIIIRY